MKGIIVFHFLICLLALFPFFHTKTFENTGSSDISEISEVEEQSPNKKEDDVNISVQEDEEEASP